MNNEARNTAAIILMAGFGNRLKSIGPKPFLFYKGRRFIEIIYERSTMAGLNPIIIVTNIQFHQALLDLQLPMNITVNTNPESGMLSSLLISLKELDPAGSGFFLCPIDYPLVQQDTFHELLLAHRSFPNHIIKPTFQSQSGHPIVFPSKVFEALKQAPLDQGARFVTRQFPHLIHFVNVTDPGILININTPELYHQYCK